MPRNISFFLTTDQVRKGTKTVTRRNGWEFIKTGDILNACVKCQGLKKGEKIQKIRQIRIISSQWDSLNTITQEDVIKEGFPDWTPEQFIDMYCKHNHIKPEDMVNRIEFEYVEDEFGENLLTTEEVNEIINGLYNLPESGAFDNSHFIKFEAIPNKFTVTKE